MTPPPPTTIEPCPNPECDPADYTDEDDFGVFETTWPITGGKEWHVECDCGYQGPRADTADEAIRLHNLLCRPTPQPTREAAQGWQTRLASLVHAIDDLIAFKDSPRETTTNRENDYLKEFDLKRLIQVRGAVSQYARVCYDDFKAMLPALSQLLEAVTNLEKLEQEWRDEMEVIKDFTGEAAITRRTVLLCADKIHALLHPEEK